MSRAAGGEIEVLVRIHQATGLILLPLGVGGETVFMVLDTGTNLSGISKDTRDKLLANGHLRATGTFRGIDLYTMSELKLGGTDLPNLTVVLSTKATELGFEGIVGLNFLRRFSDIHFHVPNLMLTLTK